MKPPPPDAAPAREWAVRLDVDPRVDAPAMVWAPAIDGEEVVVASTRIGTVRVRRDTGRVVSATDHLPSEGGIGPQPPGELLLGSAGTVGDVRSVDDELVGPGWRIGRFAWARGAIAPGTNGVLAWQLDAGKIRPVIVRDGQVTRRSEDSVDGDRALAAAFAPDGRGLLITDRAAHGFDPAGRLRFSVPLPAPDGEVRVLPTTCALGDEAYVFVEGRILLRLPTP